MAAAGLATSPTTASSFAFTPMHRPAIRRSQMEGTGLPWMANQRLHREVIRHLGTPWTFRHDRLAARLLFKAGGITAEELRTILERPRPKADRGWRMW